MIKPKKTKLTDTPKEILEIQYDLYRKMSPAKKFRIICDAYSFGQSLAMAGIRMQYPSANQDDVWKIWAKRHLGEELYNKVYGVKADE
ncbi:MAG: hypothetical protein PHP01_02820 [Phycisphaerae bacterium]|nr:hypothetical protein [Phycisphaerae bacterium]